MFNFTAQLDEQVEAHLHRLRRNGWLTYKGQAAVDLLRKVLQVNPKPHLVVHCHYNLEADPHDYAFFIPASVEVIRRHRVKLVEIKGKLGKDGPAHTLYFDPNRTTDPSGVYISSVSSLEMGFPKSTIDEIVLEPLKL